MTFQEDCRENELQVHRAVHDSVQLMGTLRAENLISARKADRNQRILVFNVQWLD